MKNRFDRVMDYIDDCIVNYYDDEDIKKGIQDLIGYNSNTFGHCLQILSGETLTSYIRRRRFYYVSEQLKDPRNGKRIEDFAADCGYAENAIFTRQMQHYYGCTPSDIRNGKAEIPNEKYSLKDLSEQRIDGRAQQVLNALESGDFSALTEESILAGTVDLYDAVCLYGFDIDTAYAIMEVAEKIDLPARKLFRVIFTFANEEQSRETDDILYDHDRVSPTEIAIACGVRTQKDLYDICIFHHCAVEDLTVEMVREYYNKKL